MVDHSRQLIYQQNVYLLKMYFPVKFIYIYIYRQMVDMCVCVRTLLSIYMSKMSGRDHENLTTK